MFQVGLSYYLRLNSGQSVSIKVNKTRKHFSRNIHGARMFPKCFPVSYTGNIVSSVSFCIQDANYACATRQGILTKIRACEHLQKFCEHEQASTHLIFASNSSEGQILRALSNWMGPFDTPSSPRVRLAFRARLADRLKYAKKYACSGYSLLVLSSFETKVPLATYTSSPGGGGRNSCLIVTEIAGRSLLILKFAIWKHF